MVVFHRKTHLESKKHTYYQMNGRFLLRKVSLIYLSTILCFFKTFPMP